VRYLTPAEALDLHRRIMAATHGLLAIRSLPALESALAQPRATFGGADLYPTVVEKAAALGFSLIQNHPFVDGNKRTGHAAMEAFLILNGYEVDATVDEQERVVLAVAAGEMDRETFTRWLGTRLVQRRPEM
jgi:death on curing protein